jgi:hypothetical protein
LALKGQGGPSAASYLMCAADWPPPVAASRPHPEVADFCAATWPDFAPPLTNTSADAIVRLIMQRGYTFMVIEHRMDFIGRICDPVICMAEGKVLAEGTLQEIKNDKQVIEAYLGPGKRNKVKAEGGHV